MNKEEGMELLTAGGMSQEEAEKFLDGRPVVTKGLQLPPDQALALMNRMSEFGMFTGPVRFYVVVTEDNEQRLHDMVSEGGKPIVEANFDLGAMSEDPIGDTNRLIADGFSGTAGLGDLVGDLDKMN